MEKETISSFKTETISSKYFHPSLLRAALLQHRHAPDGPDPIGVIIFL